MNIFKSKKRKEVVVTLDKLQQAIRTTNRRNEEDRAYEADVFKSKMIGFLKDAQFEITTDEQGKQRIRLIL